MALFDFFKKQPSENEFSFDDKELNKVENFFNFLVQSYYQAYGISKGYIASGIFGNVVTQGELQGFRQHVKEVSSALAQLYNGKDNLQSAMIDLSIIKKKLKNSFDLGSDFTKEIEKSVDDYVGNDMTSYRIMFQLASDTLYPMVADTIQHIDLANKREAIDGVVESIISENYWQGQEIIQMIETVRGFQNKLGFSKSWLKQFTFYWITN